MEYTSHLTGMRAACDVRCRRHGEGQAVGGRPESAEMGTKRKWEQCGHDRQNFLFSKIVNVDLCLDYPTVFPGY